MRKYYKQFRKMGETARNALNSARILEQWEELEGESVRLRAEPEIENYFHVYGKPESEKEREEIVRTIERDGCWIVLGEYLHDGEWEVADSIGMCIYNNPTSPFENCYVLDIMKNTLEQHKRSQLDFITG